MELTSSIQYQNQFISNKIFTVTFVERDTMTINIGLCEKFDIRKISETRTDRTEHNSKH